MQFFRLFFEKKFFFLAVRGEVKGKSIAQNENNNCICHTSYLGNSKAYDQDFWYNCVK